MTRILMVKHLGSLRPVDEAGEDALRSLGQGETIEVNIQRKRNVKHHRMFWALMSLVWQQLDHAKFRTVEDLVTEAKIITGHYERRDIVVEGQRYPVLTPRSISFAAMDQAEFDAFYERVSDWIAESILPGVTREDLRQEVEAMIGVRTG